MSHPDRPEGRQILCGMPNAASPGSDSESQRSQVLHRTFFESGWSRYLPHGVVSLFGAVVVLGSPTREQIGEFVDATSPNSVEQGLESPVWDELTLWTADKLCELDETFPGPERDHVREAAELNVSDRQERAERIAELEAHAATLGVAAPTTMGELLDFVVACSLLTPTGQEADGIHYTFNPHAPLPDEVLPLTDDQRAAEDETRWRYLHERTAQRIIALFHPGDEHRVDVKRTSLQRLARELGLDVETVRAGVVALVSDADFTANLDPDQVREHQVFEIVVDWERFARPAHSTSTSQSSFSVD